MYYRPVLKAHKIPISDKHNGQEGCNAAINSLRPRRNGHFNADVIFKCIFLNENVWFPTKMSVKFVPKGPINNILALVQIIAWRRPGDKPLSEPMRVYWGIYVSPGLNELKWNNNGITILHYVLISSEFCNWVPSLCLWSFFVVIDIPSLPTPSSFLFLWYWELYIVFTNSIKQVFSRMQATHQIWPTLGS